MNYSPFAFGVRKTETNQLAGRRAAARFFGAIAMLLVPCSAMAVGQPQTGTIDPVNNPSVSWNDKVTPGANDFFLLTVAGDPADYVGNQVTVTMVPGTSKDDFDLFIHQGSATGTIVAQSVTRAPGTPEQASFDPSVLGTGDYYIETVRIAGGPPTPTDYSGNATVNEAPKPTPSPTPEATPTPTPEATPSPTPEESPTPTPSPGESPTPTPSATPTPTPKATPSPTATPTPTPKPTPAAVELLNISARALVQSSDRVGIAGFIIDGVATKRVVMRGLGASIQVGGNQLSGFLPDPKIELHDASGAIVASNDSWRIGDQAAFLVFLGIAPSDDREAALELRLPPGAYTAVMTGSDETPGVGLVEVYDLDPLVDSHFGNLSSRAFVSTGDAVLIDGIIIRGGVPRDFVFRGIGPELTEKGVPGALADPVLEVYDENGALVAANDNWKDGSHAADILAAGLAPTDDREAAVLVTLNAGDFTCVVRGKNGTTGIGLAEAYNLQINP